MTPEIHKSDNGGMMIRTDIEGAAQILRGLAPKRKRLTQEERDKMLDDILGPEFRIWLKRRF